MTDIRLDLTVPVLSFGFGAFMKKFVAKNSLTTLKNRDFTLEKKRYEHRSTCR